LDKKKLKARFLKDQVMKLLLTLAHFINSKSLFADFLLIFNDLSKKKTFVNKKLGSCFFLSSQNVICCRIVKRKSSASQKEAKMMLDRRQTFSLVFAHYASEILNNRINKKSCNFELNYTFFLFPFCFGCLLCCRR
jgi:hypothetical protein